MAKLVKCKTCGNDVAKNANVCPHCGAKNKHRGGCSVVIVAFVLIIAVVSAINSGKSIETKEAHKNDIAEKQEQHENETIKKALDYLRRVDGICRVDVVGYDVFISFTNNELPTDYKIIANAASMNGSRALVEAGEKPSRCSVWVIPAEDDAKVGNAYYSHTARNGKAE